MGNKDPRIDTYIEKSPEFAQAILRYFREQVHANCPDVVETIKWSMPHFEYQGRILCNCAAFKQHCAISFWLGELLKIKPNAEKAMGQFGRISQLSDLPGKQVIAKLIKQAMKLQEQGVKAPSRIKPEIEKKELVIPPVFLAALKKNKAAFATFHAFSPSKKKDYVMWYEEAKTDVTREKRLTQSIVWMAEGKARNWKYEKC